MPDTILDPKTSEDNPAADAEEKIETVPQKGVESKSEASAEKTFAEFFTEETRNSEDFKKFKGAEELFKSYKQAEQALHNRVKIPDEKSTDAEKNAFYEKLGKPADPKDYAIELDAFYGEANDVTKAEFQRIFAENNLTKAQASGILQALNGAAQVHTASSSQATDQAQTKTASELKSAWGANFDMNRTLAKRAVGSVFGQEAMESIIGRNGNDKTFIEGMYKVGKMLNEKGLLGKANPKELGGYGPAEASQRYLSIINNKEDAEYKAYHNTRDPQHQAVKDKVLDLIRATQVTG